MVKIVAAVSAMSLAAIGAKRCDQITEFDPDKHDRPAKGEPIIHSIEFINMPMPDSLTEEEKTLKKG